MVDDFKDRKNFQDPTGQVHMQTHIDWIVCTGPVQAQANQTKFQLRADGAYSPPWQRCCMQLTLQGMSHAQV